MMIGITNVISDTSITDQRNYMDLRYIPLDLSVVLVLMNVLC